MKQFLRWVAPALLAVAILPASAAFAADESTIHITNNSKWEIHHFFLSPSEEDKWGPDQLGEAKIDAGGGKFELHKVPCDTWDVKLVDEDGDECVVEAVDICAAKEGWTITDEALLACEKASAED